MATATFELEIISPERTVFSGRVESAHFPGEQSPFTVLAGHAPLVSSLVEGRIGWSGTDGSGDTNIAGGFVEVCANRVVACVESV